MESKASWDRQYQRVKGQKGDTGTVGMKGAKGEPSESIATPSFAASLAKMTINESKTASFQSVFSQRQSQACVNME